MNFPTAAPRNQDNPLSLLLTDKFIGHAESNRSVNIWISSMNLTNTYEKVWKSKHTLSWTEFWARITTAARGCCSAESLCSSSEWMFLERRQFLPVLFTATPQCLELRQDNIRVCTIWADSLPLRSPLDLGSVFFFYFGCETVPLLLVPCHSSGESGLLQLQRLQVPQRNH